VDGELKKKGGGVWGGGEIKNENINIKIIISFERNFGHE